jgi:hypothetical protein
VSAAPTFTQIGTLPLFALSSRADPGLPGFWAGYRSGPASTLSGAVTLDQAWQDAGGTYVFTNARPADDGQFAAALGDYLAQTSPTALVRFLWIADAAAAPDTWQSAALLAQPAGSGAQLTWTVARGATLAVGEYAVELDRGTVLTQAPAALGPGIAASALSFAGPAATLASAAGTAWLPLAGARLACWCAELPVPRITSGDASGRDVFAGLRAGLRYAAPRGDGAPGDAVDILDAPLLAQGSAALTLHLSFDWLNPLAHARTQAGFFDAAGTGDPGPSLAATLRTIQGHATTLAPRAHGAPLRPAALVLDRSPLSVSPAPAWVYHLAPDGAFDVAVVPPEPIAASVAPEPALGTAAPPRGAAEGAAGRVMFGLSGLEYATLPAGGGTVFFAAGKPAFAPAAAADAKPVPPASAGLTGAASTAHLTLLPPAPGAGLTYYAQPQQAPLYAGGGSLGPGTLSFLEVAAAALPAWQDGGSAPPATVPALPLAGVAPADGPLAGRIERAVLAPARRQAIGVAPGEPTALPGGAGTLAATPQGLLVQVGPTGFERVVLAALPGTPAGQLDISKIGPELRAALQSNELFFAVGDPAAFLADSSVRYRLDETGLAVAAARGVPAEKIAALRQIVLPPGITRVFATETAFDDAVKAVAGSFLPLLQKIAGFLKAELSGWTFQLSPRSWRTDADNPTVMLVKYAHRSIAELAEDGSAWGWPEVAGNAQQVLRATIASTRARFADSAVPPGDPYAAFYRDVLADPAWNGVLFLNAPVSAAELPSELSFMTAGVAPDGVYAHHLGFAATPVVTENGAIAVRQTAAFGLIDYQDPADLVLDPSSPNPDFGFKTLSLTARFAGATLAGFATRVELMVNRLLGAPLTKLDPTHGNNLLLSGSSQRQGGVLGYAFALEGEHRYLADASAIDSIQVDDVRVLTSSGTANGSAGIGDLTVTFTLGGFLRFGDHQAFDMFGYGPTAGAPEADGRLRFDDLSVELRFAPGAASGRPFADQRFAVSVDSVRLDPVRSTPRNHSLIRNFPVTLTGLIGAAEGSPADAGFASISAPISQSPLPGPWWALTYRLDLGTMGALAGSTGLSLTLAAAWGPGAAVEDRPVYCGLQLPAGLQWSLEGVLKLGFRSFRFDTGPALDGRLAYVLRLQRFALQILGISLAPGNADVTLFGDAGRPDSRVVGWYAAYDDNDKRKVTP